MLETPGRRDRKKSDTRLALRQAALRLSLAHGYDNVTIEAITEAADVSVRTFFNYFDSKEDAVLGMEEDGTAWVATALHTRPLDEPPVVALRAIFVEIADRLAEGRMLWQQRAELVRTNPQLWPRMIASFSAFEGSIAVAVAERTGLDPTESLYPGVVAAAAVGAMRVALHQWQPGDQDADCLRALLAEAFDVLGRGMAPPSLPAKEVV